MKWIKRIKTDLAEYDVKITEPYIYKCGVFRIQVCTAKNIWWYPRFEIMTFCVDCADCNRANCDLIDAIKQRIAAYEVEEEKYLRIVKRLNGDGHEA